MVPPAVRARFRRQIVAPPLDAGLYEMIIPEKPRSSKPFHVTEAGRALYTGRRE
jgi:hypothetical protein